MTQEPVFPHIMLVDDDRVTNRLHRRLIEKAGLAGRLTKALDGPAALALLRAALDAGQRLPDVIFLDINMPRGGGFVFLEGYAMLPSAPNVPRLVAMLSSALLPEERGRAIAHPHVSEACARPLTAEWLGDFARRHGDAAKPGRPRYS